MANKYMKRRSTSLVISDTFISSTGKGSGNWAFSNVVGHGGSVNWYSPGGQFGIIFINKIPFV